MYHRPNGASGTQKAYLATPAYQSLSAGYAFALYATKQALEDVGIISELAIFQGDCHVDDARNRLVRDFLESDCTDLVFLDADIRWEADDLVKLLRYDVDIVGATYPLKQKTSEMPVQFIENGLEADGLIEVEGLPTGFLRIRRAVFERLVSRAPKAKPKSDARGDIPIIFERDLIDGMRWGGDYNFCRKAKLQGFRTWCDPDVVLEHGTDHIWRGSLNWHIRAREGKTLAHFAGRVREGGEALRIVDFEEVVEFIDNPFGLSEDNLAVAASLAREANGPILEIGSGLSTIAMRAASDQDVWCIEHDELYAEQLRRMARAAGVEGIYLVRRPIEDGWYDVLFSEMPDRFALALVDGPPRYLADRTKFFYLMGDMCDLIFCNDVDDAGYLAYIEGWAGKSNRAVHRIGLRSVLIEREGENE